MLPHCIESCRQLPSRAEDWIGELRSSRLYLNPDQRYQGSCILVYRRHVVEVTDLPSGEYEALMNDVRDVAAAVRDVAAPHKLNIATLGNMVAHLHVHIIARRHDDPAWPGAIWAKPLSPVALPSPEKHQLIERLRSSLRA